MKPTNSSRHVFKVVLLSCYAALSLGSSAVYADTPAPTTGNPAAATKAPSDPKDLKQITAPAEAPASPLTLRIGLPVWVTAISGSVGVRNLVSPAAYVPFNDLYNHLDYSIPGSVEMGYGKWGVLLDGQYSKLSETLNPPGPLLNSAAVQFEQGFAELNVSYKALDTDKFALAPFIGTRFEYVIISGQASAT